MNAVDEFYKMWIPDLNAALPADNPSFTDVAALAKKINGAVVIGGVQVHPGDLVVADDTGVCFIPRDYIAEVLEAAEKKARSETKRVQAIDSGLSVPDVLRSGE